MQTKTRAYDLMINGASFQTNDPVSQGRQILTSAGFEPADECVLIQEFNHGTRLLGLDDAVDLRQPGVEAFWAFKSDRTFRFTLNEHSFDWGEEKIAEPMIRSIGHVPNDDVIVLERVEERDRVLGDDDYLSLGKAGTEHLRTQARLITVYYNDEATEVPRGDYTTEQLITLFGVEAGYVLDIVDKDGQLKELKSGEHEHLREGMRFYSQVPCGGTS